MNPIAWVTLAYAGALVAGAAAYLTGYADHALLTAWIGGLTAVACTVAIVWMEGRK